MDSYRIADCIVNALMKPVVEMKPWRFLLVENVLPADVFQACLDSPPTWKPDAVGRRSVWLLDRSTRDPWRSVCDGIAFPIVAEAFASATGSERGFAEPRVNVDREGYSLRPHPDSPIKRGTLAVSLAREPQPDFGLRVGDKKKITFEPNSGYAFKRTNATIHSVDLVKEGERVTLMVPFFVVQRFPFQV